MDELEVVQFFPLFEDVQFPVRSTEGSSGIDIYTYLHDADTPASTEKNAQTEPSSLKHKTQDWYDLTEKEIESAKVWYLDPGKTKAIPTGLRVVLPYGLAMVMASRSGLFLNHQILVQGVIDPDYRGELKILIMNLGESTFVIHHKMKLAQALLYSVLVEDAQIEYKTVHDTPPPTSRQNKGFGSTGYF